LDLVLLGHGQARLAMRGGARQVALPARQVSQQHLYSRHGPRCPDLAR
jgi:hypothetical protein